MPELPEVETMVRGIRPALEGERLAAVDVIDCGYRPILISPRLAAIQELSAGATVVAVRRRAKRILIELENMWTFVIEPRMTGLMLLGDPPTREHLRFEWKVARGRKRASVWFWDRRGLGTLRLLNQDEMTQQLGPERLGKDALEISPDELHQLLKKTQQPVKVTLLNQKLVAGIGNLYASEILHRTGIHPQVKSSSLSKAAIQRVHAAILEILNEAIRYEGSTLGDGTYRNVLNQDGSYQNKHRVYGKPGEVCSSCGKGTIERIVQAQRSTFFCPRCQKKS